MDFHLFGNSVNCVGRSAIDVDRTTVYSAYYFNIEKIAFDVLLVHWSLVPSEMFIFYRQVWC